jgi:hypothetical protein
MRVDASSPTASTVDGAFATAAAHPFLASFDLDVGVFQNVPAPTNLVVPRYGYVDAFEL